MAEAEAVDSLGDEVEDGVLDEQGLAMIGEAAGEVLEDTGAEVHFPQEQASGVIR